MTTIAHKAFNQLYFFQPIIKATTAMKVKETIEAAKQAVLAKKEKAAKKEKTVRGTLSIGKRYNPQLPKPYYIAYGKLTKTRIKEIEKPSYGSIWITTYDSKEAYDAEIARLEAEGYRVTRR
jgi:hypothetical protein